MNEFRAGRLGHDAIQTELTEDDVFVNVVMLAAGNTAEAEEEHPVLDVLREAILMRLSGFRFGDVQQHERQEDCPVVERQHYLTYEKAGNLAIGLTRVLMELLDEDDRVSFAAALTDAFSPKL